MKRFSLFLMVMISGFMNNLSSFSQGSPTSITLDFTEGKRGNFYCWNSKFAFSFENDEMKVVWNKPDFDWDQMVYWVAPFKVSTTNPYMMFKYKVGGGERNWSVTFKYDEFSITTLPLTLFGDDEYHVAFLDLTENMEDLSGSDYEINEIQFDPGAPSSGTLFMDDFKLGDAARPSYKKPTITRHSNVVVASGASAQTLDLTGITDGGEGYQTLAVSAVVSDTGLITTPEIDYTSPNTTGTLSFTPKPGKLGVADITVTVKDDGPLQNEIKMTFKVAVIELEGNGFTDDFEAATKSSFWKISSAVDSMNQKSGMLYVYVNKSMPWESFTYEPEKAYDFTSKPLVNLRLNTNEPAEIAVYLKDVFGQSALRKVRVYNTTGPVNYCFDFTGEPDIDLTAINGLIFAVNGPSQTAVRDFTFDDLKAGEDAFHFPNAGGIKDKAYYISSGNKTILLTDIQNASSILPSGGESLVENLTAGSITGGTASLNFTLKEGVTGKDTISITLAGGLETTNTLSFTIRVNDNNNPTLDSIPDQEMVAGESLTLKLTGITDGDPDAEQDVTVNAIPGGANIEFEGPEYTGGTYAGLTVKAINPDTLQNMVLVSDGIINDTVYFNTFVYQSLNLPPVMDPVSHVTAFFGSGEKTVSLTGISDGDGTSQSLSLEAVSSDETIVSNPINVIYSGGSTATLTFTPNQAVAGKAIITLTLADDGGSAGNNGDKSSVYTFTVETRPNPVTGYVVPMTDWIADSTANIWGPEGWGVQINLGYVDSGSFQSMRIDMQDKWDYGGIWMDLPMELDLTDNPFISYEVYSVDTTTFHWNYFYDEGSDGEADRNIQNSGEHMYSAPSGKWTLLSYDYSDEGDLNNSSGVPINISRINAVLLNLHNRAGSWPFTNYTGTVYYRNIRIGDQAIIPPKIYSCTMDGISDMGIFINAGDIQIPLTGISDGQDSTSNITLTAGSNNLSVVPAPVLSSVDADGNATLSFTAGSKVGVSTLTIGVSAPGSVDKTITFRVAMTSDQVDKAATLTVDPDQTFQTIQGMGTFETSPLVADKYIDMGSSAVRLGVIGNQVEWENDNDDPFVLNMEALDHSAWDFDYLRYLKTNGVEKFILTLWSAPAWMKRNLSLDLTEQAIEWENTDNKVEPYYYDEYAENIIATIRLLKNEGIEVYAVCPQNEPAFNEPYPSGILGPDQFRDFIRILGPRLDAEGLDTRIYMPEQVFGISFYSMAQYITTVKADPIADQNTDIIAVHGYANDGITPGAPDYSQWNGLWTSAHTGDYPKELWMTETYIEYTNFLDAMSLAGAIHGGLKYGNLSWWTNWSFEGMQLTKMKPNSSFYASKNFFKFIRPGAIRIGSSSDHDDLLETAFYHPQNKTYTIVMINKGSTGIPVNLKGSNIPSQYQAFRTSQFLNCIQVDSVKDEIFLLPPGSITTLYATVNSALTMDAIQDIYLVANAPRQTLNATGISNGSGSISGLSLSVRTDNADLIPDLAVGAIGAGGTAKVTFTPAANTTGTAKVTLVLSDGINPDREVSFYVVVGTTGVTEAAADVLMVYPNPAEDQLYIVLPESGFDVLTVTDISGKVIESMPVSASTIILKTHNYQRGIYLIRVTGKNETMVSRFIVN
jgi:glucuronoarabinoxylan endo-1,4-beta-xylanase